MGRENVVTCGHFMEIKLENRVKQQFPNYFGNKLVLIKLLSVLYKTEFDIFWV